MYIKQMQEAGGGLASAFSSDDSLSSRQYGLPRVASSDTFGNVQVCDFFFLKKKTCQLEAEISILSLFPPLF